MRKTRDITMSSVLFLYLLKMYKPPENTDAIFNEKHTEYWRTIHDRKT